MKSKSLYMFLLLIIFSCNGFSQSINTTFNKDDIEYAFEILGINLYKFNFEEIAENYHILIIVDEYVPDSILHSKEYLFDPSRIKDDQPNEIKFISKRGSYDSETLWLKIIHPSQHVLARFDLNEQYRESHFWREFNEGKLEYDQKIPILLYGTAWEVKYPNGVTVMKFCPNILKRDLSNEAFEKMKHYYVISYELKQK